MKANGPIFYNSAVLMCTVWYSDSTGGCWGGERLIIMAGTEQMEWHQTLGNHVFDVFDTIPLISLRSLPRACSAQ